MEPHGPYHRPQNDVTKARRKRARGEDLTPDESEILRAYYAKYGPRKQGVHLKGDKQARFRELASRKGTSISSLLQDLAEQALQGPGEMVRELKDENQRLRDEIAGLRGTSGQLAVENSRFQARNEAMEASLMEALDQALSIQEALK
jgi:hypothetical protein